MWTDTNANMLIAQSMSQHYHKEIMIVLRHADIYQTIVVRKKCQQQNQVTFKRDRLKWSFIYQTYKKLTGKKSLQMDSVLKSQFSTILVWL